MACSSVLRCGSAILPLPHQAAPLTRSPEAHYIDTTSLTVEEVVGRIVELVRRVRAGS